VLTKYREDFPDNFINAGIAEQNMTAVAAGMALEGNCVFTYSIANFPTLRPLEQIRNCVAYHNANVKIVSIGAGMAYGGAGMTHHGTEDIAMLRSIPNMVVFSPADKAEAIAVTNAAYKWHGPCYIRLGKGREADIHTVPIKNYEIGKSLQIAQGDDVAIFTTGAIASEVVKTAKQLKDSNISVAIYTFPTIKPIDQKIIEECAKKYSHIFTVEEHDIIGGLGSAVSEILAEMDSKRAMLKRIGLNDTFTSIVGDQEYLRDCYGLSATKMTSTIIDALKGQK
jgi:transketolase